MWIQTNFGKILTVPDCLAKIKLHIRANSHTVSVRNPHMNHNQTMVEEPKRKESVLRLPVSSFTEQLSRMREIQSMVETVKSN